MVSTCLSSCGSMELVKFSPDDYTETRKRYKIKISTITKKLYFMECFFNRTVSVQKCLRTKQIKKLCIQSIRLGSLKKVTFIYSNRRLICYKTR